MSFSCGTSRRSSNLWRDKPCFLTSTLWRCSLDPATQTNAACIITRWWDTILISRDWSCSTEASTKTFYPSANNIKRSLENSGKWLKPNLPRSESKPNKSSTQSTTKRTKQQSKLGTTTRSKCKEINYSMKKTKKMGLCPPLTATMNHPKSKTTQKRLIPRPNNQIDKAFLVLAALTSLHRLFHPSLSRTSLRRYFLRRCSIVQITWLRCFTKRWCLSRVSLPQTQDKKSGKTAISTSWYGSISFQNLSRTITIFSKISNSRIFKIQLITLSAILLTRHEEISPISESCHLWSSISL